MSSPLVLQQCPHVVSSSPILLGCRRVLHLCSCLLLYLLCRLYPPLPLVVVSSSSFAFTSCYGIFFCLHRLSCCIHPLLLPYGVSSFSSIESSLPLPCQLFLQFLVNSMVVSSSPILLLKQQILFFNCFS